MAELVMALPLIEKLLHLHLNDVPVDSDDDYNCLNILGANKLIDNINGQWKVTERGTIYCRWLCETPLPVFKWVDPRTEKQ